MALTKADIAEHLSTELGLNKRDAKELVEAAPKAVLEKVARDAAAKAKESLEAAGATVTIK